MTPRIPPALRRARGAASVEFALVSLIFITLLFAVFEYARLLYVLNSVQEVTRRAAREACVRWTDDGTAIKQLALFGESALPAGAEVTSANIQIDYLQANGNAIGTPPDDPADNLSACGDALRANSCIDSVRVTITGVTYVPLISLFGFLNVTLPESQVTMHAESMGFET